MARLDEKQKKRLLDDLLKGTESVRVLAKRYGVSNATIQKYKYSIDPESERIVNAGIAYKTALSEIREPEKVNAIVNAVDERTKHLIFFNNSALKNQQLANNRLKQKEHDVELSELEAHSRITARNKETVLGKSPDTAIQVNNNEAPRLVIQSNAVRD
jgi:hypothetical protein